MTGSSSYDAIVIGGSSGALDALSIILPALPAGFSLPIAIVLHVPPNRPSLLAGVLAARCALGCARSTTRSRWPLRRCSSRRPTTTS
jgi:chemotaxis response regulator CheB